MDDSEPLQFTRSTMSDEERMMILADAILEAISSEMA